MRINQTLIWLGLLAFMLEAVARVYFQFKQTGK